MGAHGGAWAARRSRKGGPAAGGAGSEVEVLGTTVTLGSVQDGRANISVGGASVSCGQGESVTAGPLALECTSVSGDTVELTATLN